MNLGLWCESASTAGN